MNDAIGNFGLTNSQALIVSVVGFIIATFIWFIGRRNKLVNGLTSLLALACIWFYIANKENGIAVVVVGIAVLAVVGLIMILRFLFS